MFLPQPIARLVYDLSGDVLLPGNPPKVCEPLLTVDTHQVQGLRMLLQGWLL